jgi:hypothetical protein
LRRVRTVISLTLLFILALPGFPSQVSAESSVKSGSVNYAVPNPEGLSSYTIQYSYPSNVTEGSYLNVTLSLYVDSLTGLKLYLIEYAVTVTIYSPTGGSVTRTVNSTSPYLYPGSHWGPIQVSLPIDKATFNLPSEKSVIANVSLALGTEVWWDQPYNFHYPESGSQNAGTVLIIGYEGPVPNYFGFGVTVLLGAAATVVGLYLWDTRRWGKVPEKPYIP